MQVRKAIGAVLATAVLTVLNLPSGLAEEEAPSEPLTADEIVLKNGSRVLGVVTSVRDGVVTLNTDFAGTVTIDQDQVASITTAEPVTLLMADNAVISEGPLQIEEGTLHTTAAYDAYSLEELAVVNPEPWELGKGYRWTGLVNFALVMERGNTDTDELDYKLESQWLSLRDRYTFFWRGENDEANGEKNADNWRTQLKWDYFLKDPNYWGLQALAEQDEFQDLDLRFVVGPYYGRQLYAAPEFSFAAEVGVAYVEEDFIVAEDQEYGALNWDFDASSNYLGGDSNLYFKQIGIWNLEDTSDVIVNSTFGLAFPLLWNFEAAAEVLLEYDSGAVENVDELDETYRLRLGYAW
ncbi:MAG: DUF481 domain-containing protein [Pseudomonadota bacterium]